MKKSKLQRKFVNQMRGMGEVPWPARAYRYPPTFGRLAGRRLEVGVCDRQVGETKVKQGRLKRKQTVAVPCGGKLIAKLNLGKRRVYCESCRARKRQRRLELRFAQQLQSRFGIAPQQQVQEERRTSRMLAKFRRSGVR